MMRLVFFFLLICKKFQMGSIFLEKKIGSHFIITMLYYTLKSDTLTLMGLFSFPQIISRNLQYLLKYVLKYLRRM